MAKRQPSNSRFDSEPHPANNAFDTSRGAQITIEQIKNASDMSARDEKHRIALRKELAKLIREVGGEAEFLRQWRRMLLLEEFREQIGPTRW